MKKRKIDNNQEVFDFIAETGSLMFMPRTHIRSLINTFDNIASHSHHTGIIAYCLARLEGLSHEDGLKALAMGVLHDTAEARTVDLDYPAKHYGQVNERLAREHQLGFMSFAKDLKKLISEYEERNTLIAKCAKDADAIEQLYQEWILTNLGNKMAERWLVGDYIHRVPNFRTKSAKKLVSIMKKSKPHDWWFKDLVDEGVNYDHLNSKK